MEPPTEPIEVIEVKSLHGQPATMTTVKVRSCQDVAVSLVGSFAHEVADKIGLPWTQDYEDASRLFVQALVDAAEERLSDAIIELTREMLADRT
jgi:hypothetical protein